jgi:hypothetical protein
MVFFNAATKELNVKIVYYGPGLSGKTTNLQNIYESLPENDKGRMLSLATSDDRTIFFDFLPLELGEVRGMKTRVQLYTVPGQVYYNTTRKLVLRGCDGVVFIADSQKAMKQSNIESLANLRQNLIEQGDNLDGLPLVIQYNKRDLTDIMSHDELRADINPKGLSDFEAIALEGSGVFETLKEITKLTLKHISSEQGIKLSIQVDKKPDTKKPAEKTEPKIKAEERIPSPPPEKKKKDEKAYAQTAPFKSQKEKEDDDAIVMGWDKRTDGISFAAAAFQEDLKDPKTKHVQVKKTKAESEIIQTAEDLLTSRKKIPRIADEIKVELTNKEIFIDQSGIRVPVKVIIPSSLKNIKIRLDMTIEIDDSED